MFRKAVTLLFLLSPAVSYAGLFDSTPELKCGNDNAVTAAFTPKGEVSWL